MGAQGGDLESVSKYGLNKDCGLLINSSRGIIYAGNDENFANAAKKEAKALAEEMKKYLESVMSGTFEITPEEVMDGLYGNTVQCCQFQ